MSPSGVAARRLVTCGRSQAEYGGGTPIASGRHRGPSARFRYWLAVFTLAFAAFTLIVRALPLTNNVTLVVAVGSPYIAAAAAVTLVLSLIERQVALSVVAVVIVTANLAIQIPWYYFATPVDVGDHVEIRVLSSNLRKGRADVPAFAELARSSADVMMLSELTPDWVRHFYSMGIKEDFPYSLLVPAPDAGGFGIWSRFPLEQIAPLKGGNMIAARMDLPGVRVDPVVAGLHITNPLTYYGRAFRQWREEISAAKLRMGTPCRGIGA